MNVEHTCSRSVATAEASETLRDAARRMVRQSVGTLVVIDARDDEIRPIGILTDRDIVTRGIAPGLDLDETPLSMVMSVPVQCIQEDRPLEEALEIMSRRSIRRLVVTDEEGILTGIIALDDVLDTLVDEVGAIGRLLAKRPPIYG
jgi:CBS domain-containing protein